MHLRAEKPALGQELSAALAAIAKIVSESRVEEDDRLERQGAVLGCPERHDIDARLPGGLRPDVQRRAATIALANREPSMCSLSPRLWQSALSSLTLSHAVDRAELACSG